MRRLTFILFVCAALLAGGAAFAEPGEAEVMVTNGHLSVTAQDAAIGNILSEISQQAGFELDINPEVSQKTVTTKFSGLDIQKGIERLLALVRQKDYFIYYKPDGGIRKLEVHAPSETSSPATSRPQMRDPNNYRPNNRRFLPPRPQIRPTPPVPNNTYRPQPVRPSTPRRTPVRQPSSVRTPSMPVNPQNQHRRVIPAEPVGNVPETRVPPTSSRPENTGKMPYIPPARMPSYIPPKH